MNVRELCFSTDPDCKPVLYACGECGSCYSPKVYACTDAVARETARAAAEKCCTPSICSVCGVAIGDYWTLCEKHQEQAKLRRAKPIPAAEWHDPVHTTAVSGDWEDGFCSNTDALLESVEDHMAWGDLDTPPAYCWPCTARPLALNADSLLEQAVDDAHEDAMDQIVDADAVYAFVEAWNAKQTCKTWYPDHTRVVVLDQKRFEEMLKDG